MAKKTQKTIEAPAGAERFTASMAPTEANGYAWLSVHVFNNVRYQVVAILNDGNSVSVEFLRLQS